MKEASYLAMTLARLGQARQLYNRVSVGKPVEGTVAAIVAVDLADGMLARRANADGPKRRLLDSVVDSAIISAGLISIYKKEPKSRPYVGLLALREAFVASGWGIDLAKNKRVKKGDVFHKLPSLAIAAFGVAATRKNKTALNLTGGIAVGINAALAYDYYRGWTNPERNTELDTGVEEVPGFYGARDMVRKYAKRNLYALKANPEPFVLEPGDTPDVITLPEDIIEEY